MARAMEVVDMVDMEDLGEVMADGEEAMGDHVVHVPGEEEMEDLAVLEVQEDVVAVDDVEEAE